MILLKGNYNIGARFKVMTQNGRRDLGLGTYLGDDDILLDRGTKARGRSFEVELVGPSRAPSFLVELQNDMRLYTGLLDSRLAITDGVLKKGTPICIDNVALMRWDHAPCVAGCCTVGGRPLWMLMSQLELPYERHLSCVA